MARTYSYSVAWLLGLAALAGCIGVEDAQQQGVDDLSRPGAEFDENTGAIQGVVQSDELLPIEGAQVGVLETDKVAVTDAAGKFGIGNVQPGTYRVVAQALGYEAQGKQVDIVAGQATDVSFALPALPVEGPRSILEVSEVVVSAVMWKLTPDCIYTDVNPLVKTCGGVRTGCDGECEVHYDEETFTGDWNTIVAEIAWEPQTGATGRGFHFDLNAPNTTRGTGGSINQADSHTFQAATDQSPIQHRVDLPTTLEERGIPKADWYPYPETDCTAPTEGAENCDWFYRVFAASCDLGICPDGFGPDYGVMQEGRATVYFSVFYVEPAEPEYTALPDY